MVKLFAQAERTEEMRKITKARIRLEGKYSHKAPQSNLSIVWISILEQRGYMKIVSIFSIF